MTTTSARKGPKITAKTREQEFPGEFDALSHTILICKFCCYEIERNKRSTITDHLQSSKHLACKLPIDKAKPQITLENTLSRQDRKQEMILDFVQMMAEAKILFHKKDKMHWWLKKYVNNGGCIPKADTLRKDYIAKILDKQKQKTKDRIKGQPLAILVDSSPDRQSRNVVNTIVICSLTGEKYLLDTSFLDSMNNITIFHLIDKVRREYNIKLFDIDNFVCDSVKYNIKLYKGIRETINPNLRLMRCWAHLLDLVSDTWQDSLLFSKVHALTSRFQSILNKSGSKTKISSLS